MVYKFKTASGEVKHMYYNRDNKFSNYGIVSWCEDNKEHSSVMLMDDEYRLYFMYNDERIYFTDYLADTPEQLVEKINKHEHVKDSDLVCTLMKYGIDSLLVMKHKRIKYKFNETDFFKIYENYKISITPYKDKDKQLYKSETFLISDLMSILIYDHSALRLKLNKDVEYRKITPEMIEDALDLGWCETDARRGYSVFTSDFGNGALHIEAIGEMNVFYSDDDAAVQAEYDGIKLIKDMKFSDEHYAHYLDTPENRELLKDLCM